MIGLLLLGQLAAQPRALTDEAARSYLASKKVPGFAIAVSKNGRMVYQRGFGTTGAVKSSVPGGKTLLRLGSVSKPMTALMVMRLAEQGKVRLDDDVRRYVPSFPDKGGTITLRQVLSHTSGIRHYAAGKRDGGHFDRCADALAVWQDDPLLFSPGQRYSYSTHAYTLLGAVVEHVTGMSYNRAFGQLVRAKAGTISPQVEHRQSLPKGAKDRAGLFSLKGGEPTSAEPDDLSWKTSGGGLEGSAEDLCRIGDTLIAGKIVSLETLLKMGTPVQPREGRSSYGLGFAVGKNYLGHGGAQLGARSFWRIYPRQGVVVTVMSNIQENPIESLGTEVSKIWTGAP